MPRPSTRRRFLASTAVTGLGAIAGCLSSGADDRAGAAGTQTPTETPEMTPPESLDDWLADANGYDGDPPRYGPGSRPSVEVGVDSEDGIAFSPPVIEVAPTAIVRWDWTGHGGQQNVVALDGTFDSGRTNAQPGTSYHFAFEETGEHAYVSEPHREEGMKGAVIVKEPPSTGYPAVDQWLVSTGNFDGTVVDRTDADTATVTVGADGNGGTFAFDPPVLTVSPATTVRWEWTGNGGGHNVVFEDADIASGDVEADESTTFEHSFETAGSYRYFCEPHRGLDMKGAIVVE